MQIPTFKMIKSNVRGLYEGTHPDPDSVPSLVDTWCDALADDRANHAAQIATLTAELHKEEEECERMTLQAQALSSIVEQVADCLITEREEDGSPVWAGKSPSIWVLEKLKDIKQVATLAAERDHLQAIVDKAKRLMNECDGTDIFEGWLKIEPLADQLFAALDND